MYRFMIVDDEALIRRGIKQLINLSSFGIESIYEASNGEEAWDLFLEHKPQIVLVDINMPKMDGLTLSRKIKALSPNTKIAIITGYDYFDYAQNAIKIGVEDYILKPVSKQDITEIITKLIHSIQKENLERESQKLSSSQAIEEEMESKNNYRKQIEEILEASYTDSSLSLSSLADQLHLSSAYLSVLFKKYFGIPFQDYLLEKRMARAKLLLLTTELKNYEIAERVGFEDVNYFGLKFKKYYQTSPKQYKEKVMQDEKK